jgi:Leucine-rich repeat (LRR) protein
MMLFGLFLVLSVPLAFSVVIDCEFKHDSWACVDNVYWCKLISDPSITERDTVVTAATGSHERLMNHATVTGFYGSGKTINFMPRGLNEMFPNLIIIRIVRSKLKVIRQADLQWFPELKYLDLNSNDIKTIEQDLFKYNPLLLVIYIEYNKISRVHPNVFDHLNQLINLDMTNNVCVSAHRINRASVLELIANIKHKCGSDIEEDVTES